MKKLSASDKERFFKYVEKTEGCWNWTANKVGRGYGGFSLDSRKERAHRISWEMANEMSIPKNKMVLHTCDNSGCVNPEHLYIGTHQQNMDDMTARDRRNPPKGEEHHKAKLTEGAVLEMRSMWKSGSYTQREIGDAFNVTRRYTKEIVNNRAWKRM